MNNMNIDNLKSNNSLNLANFVSGIVFVIITYFIIKEIPNIKIFNFIEELGNRFSFIALKISLLLIAFIIGFFIQGIRYFGFNYYMTIYKKAQRKRHAGKKYPCIKQRIIFYIFRNGTVVEECLDNVKSKYDNPNENETLKTNNLRTKILKKKDGIVDYKWIQESGKQAANDMWTHAIKINKFAPREDVYKYYNYSEVFQCLDSTFLLFSTITATLVIINVLGLLFSFDFRLNISLIIILIANIVLHLISKKCAKMYARRFLYKIQKSLDSHSELHQEIQ